MSPSSRATNRAAGFCPTTQNNPSAQSLRGGCVTTPTLVKPAYANFPEFSVTFGPEVCELAALAGLPPDPEQALALDALFALDPSDQV